MTHATDLDRMEASGNAPDVAGESGGKSDDLHRVYPSGLTYDECEQAARNVGVDLRCGECASHFYTGGGSAAHEPTCATLPLLRQRLATQITGRDWMEHVQHQAGTDEALPRWSDGVPWCAESCTNHDGKRCRVLGVRAPDICEPVVREMSRLLGASPRKPTP